MPIPTIGGVPIGGSLSAQLASLYCVSCESIQLKKNIYSACLFGSPLRFKDNILMLILPDISVVEVLLLFKLIYDLEFTKEQITNDTMDFLEMRIKMVRSHDNFFQFFQINWKLVLTSEGTNEQRRKYMLVQGHSSNAREVFKCYLPNVFIKCKFLCIRP